MTDSFSCSFLLYLSTTFPFPCFKYACIKDLSIFLLRILIQLLGFVKQLYLILIRAAIRAIAKGTYSAFFYNLQPFFPFYFLPLSLVYLRGSLNSLWSALAVELIFFEPPGRTRKVQPMYDTPDTATVSSIGSSLPSNPPGPKPVSLTRNACERYNHE